MSQLDLLITVKAYPNPSKQLGEAACIAGVSKAGKFVRLYPIPFRDLDDSKRFQKYQWVRLRVADPKTDNRPETLRPNFSTLEVLSEPLSTKNSWAARWDVLRPLVSHSMCDIQDAQAKTKASLGLFKPAEILDVEAEEESPREWTQRERDRLAQQDFFLSSDKESLEKIPIAFFYRFRCQDCRNKNPHRMKIIDWELAQLWRRERRGHDERAAIQNVRERFLDDLCGPKINTHFFTGNMQRYPKNFLILGVMWPKISRQVALF